jgi:hypothetical protein
MSNPLATIDDYTLLIGPVATADEPKVDYMLLVASSVVVGRASGLLPWWQYDPNATDPDTGLPYPDPGAVPEPAVLVTCQTADLLVTSPRGVSGPVVMEKIGLAESQYATRTDPETLLPVGWRSLLRPWRPPDLASVALTVPHPSEYRYGGYGADWWLYELGDVLDGTAPPSEGP